ncbi:MAG: hypothetical protein CM1200mP35_10280 [Chloroflexota bacterium]|nr:MAG: hypothetical protein CM1200mP35_10280 [Chloroflexota bacterium]
MASLELEESIIKDLGLGHAHIGDTHILMLWTMPVI